MSPFSSRSWCLYLAALCYGCSTSQLTLLPLVLSQQGLSASSIAILLSAHALAVVAGMLASSPLAQRLGARQPLLLGGLLSGFALALLPLDGGSGWFTALGLCGRGVGFGMFTTAGQLLAKAQAPPEHQVSAVGQFTVCFLVPNLCMPALGEWALGAWGHTGYFGLLVLPVLPSVLAGTYVPCFQTLARAVSSGSYQEVLHDRQMWPPILTAVQGGVAYGVAITFLPVLLVSRAIPIAVFFTTFAVVLLAMRVVGLRYVESLSPPTIACVGLGAYAAGLIGLAVSAMGGIAGLAGALFAVGYGVLHPTCVEWAARAYAPAERARPVALINIAMHAGMILSANVLGTALGVLGWPGVLLLLAGCILSYAVGYTSLANSSCLRPRTATAKPMASQPGRRSSRP